MKMKKLISVLVLFIASYLWGQNLPTVVDNSAWFPPAKTQYWNSCQIFSLTYYLKSYNWNRHFQRNPSLPENQFSPYFVWNQIIDPIYHWAEYRGTFDFLSTQGAATVADFPMVDNPDFSYQELMPSAESREKALSFLSSGLKNIRGCNPDSISAHLFISQLKDSLAKGVCFTIGFPLFPYINNLYNQSPAVYRCSAGISRDSMYASHMAAVVGYDDNIGGFKVINSWGPQFGDNGFFYLDYKWLYLMPGFTFDVYFLEEDFSHQSRLSLDVKINNFVTGVDLIQVNNFIVDTLYLDQSNRRVDFPDMTAYFSFPNLLRLLEVNGTKIVDKNTNLFMPAHNHDGKYQIISDLSSYSQAGNFQSAKMVMYDPISAKFSGSDGHTIYEYQRTPQAQIESAYIRFTDSGKKVIGREVSLPDTTVVCENYYSFQMTYHEGGFEVFVKKSTCTFKRRLITFSVSDTVATNLPPVFTAVPDTIKAYKDSVVTFQFQAVDPEGEQIVYSVIGGHGATIDSTTGLFSYPSQQVGSFVFTVQASDGNGAAVDTFTVKVDNITAVDDHFSLPNKYELSQNYPNPFNPATTISFSLLKSGPASLKVYNLLGQEVALLVNEELSAGSHQVKFDASRLASGIYVYVLKANDFTATKKMILMK